MKNKNFFFESLQHNNFKNQTTLIIIILFLLLPMIIFFIITLLFFKLQYHTFLNQQTSGVVEQRSSTPQNVCVSTLNSSEL